MQDDLNQQGVYRRPYVEVLAIESLEFHLVSKMKALFEQHYDRKRAGTVKRHLAGEQKISPRFNRRGVEFLSVASGAIIINGQMMKAGEMVRIDPGEIVEMKACEDSELISHVFPYHKALVHQAAPCRKDATLRRPKASVIIIAKDIENHICHSIFSCVEQTLDDIEIIIVDDGSTDHTLAKCCSMAYFDQRIKVHAAALGRNAIRRFGLQQAKGEFCLIIDGDDWLNRDALEKMFLAAKKYNSECVVFGFDHVSDKSAEVWNPIYPTNVHLQSPPMYYNKDDNGALWASYLNHTIWMYFFSSRIKDNIASSLIASDLYEDLPFYFAVIKDAYHPILWNEVLYHYRRDRIGQSTANWEKVSAARKLTNLAIAVKYCLEIIKEDRFLQLIFIYKIRRIVDHELHVCMQNSDNVGVSAWNKIWRDICGTFSLDLASHIVDDQVRKVFLDTKQGSRAS